MLPLYAMMLPPTLYRTCNHPLATVKCAIILSLFAPNIATLVVIVCASLTTTVHGWVTVWVREIIDSSYCSYSLRPPSHAGGQSLHGEIWPPHMLGGSHCMVRYASPHMLGGSRCMVRYGPPHMLGGSHCMVRTITFLTLAICNLCSGQ